MQDALARMRQREGDRIPKRRESEERSEDVKRQKVSPTEHQKKPDVADGTVSDASGDLEYTIEYFSRTYPKKRTKLSQLPITLSRLKRLHLLSLKRSLTSALTRYATVYVLE